MRNRRALGAGLALALTAAAAGAAPASAPPEPDSYRLDAYRAPVPATLRGATVIDTAKAHDLWRRKAAVFVDALPHAPKPEGLPKNVVWREQPRFDIPGSVWLPDTGFGALSEATQLYLEKGLTKASGGDKTRPLVFYCLTDCWMSWNAARRALTLGYANVLWYPEGTDGWAAAAYPLEERKPEARE
ncbi:MAG: PQQ-dependent catabolism-associated CXXCW motif protein [Methylocystis sp.]|uniref:PQQ-dependent catabolism-associated CXXCW motif protein n=1 Tax=Methylocystis sp. TaxID=1911079 RepID=UPI003DA30AD7